jgi:hypothetical protein
VSAAVVFFDFVDFFAVVVLVSLAAGATAALSAVSDGLLFLDFAVVELPLAGVAVSAEVSAFFDLEEVFEADESAVVVLSAEASAFFDFEDFFAVEESAVAALSVASAFFDLEDFFAVELSAAAGVSAESVFLLLVDFLVVEESAAAVSSAVVAFFFFFDLAALVSPGSVVVGVCAACAADAWRRARFANTSSNATISETGSRLRVRFIFGEFLSPAAHRSFRLARGWRAWGGWQRSTNNRSAVLAGRIGEIMCEGRGEVKPGQQPNPKNAGELEILSGHAQKHARGSPKSMHDLHKAR